MTDDLNELLKKTSPNVKNDQFSMLCYQVFIENRKGRVLMAHLYDEYVNRPFTNLLDKDPKIDTNKIVARAMQRDLVQSLLFRAQQYESVIKKS